LQVKLFPLSRSAEGTRRPVPSVLISKPFRVERWTIRDSAKKYAADLNFIEFPGRPSVLPQDDIKLIIATILLLAKERRSLTPAEIHLIVTENSNEWSSPMSFGAFSTVTPPQDGLIDHWQEGETGKNEEEPNINEHIAKMWQSMVYRVMIHHR
jgi:hypothetical protein